MSQTLTPEQFVDQLAAALPRSTPTEARRLVEHARAWAVVFYRGEVPPALAAQLAQMEEQCQS